MTQLIVEHAPLHKIETELLLEGVLRYYGLDFREYSPSYLERRLQHRARMENVKTFTSLLEKILHDRECFYRLVADLSINVTAMFRDPSFFLCLRRDIAPALRRLNSVRIWVAGCSTGEEAYSLAIMLQEEDLAEKAQIYATDINPLWLERAKLRRFPLYRMREYTQNYLQAGGTQPFSAYYTAVDDYVVIQVELARNIHFFQHNLATDGSFHEFDLILCRNVLIYFTKKLQKRVHQLFYDSLSNDGYLALGRQETVGLSDASCQFDTIVRPERLYRKGKR